MNVFEKYNGTGDSFIIPSWANVIGEEAFKECHLKYVSMTHVESISDYAFIDSEIDKIYINNGCKSIGVGSFMRSMISDMTLPESVTEIGEQAFHSCHFLKTVIMKGGVSEIPKECFANCTMLENVVHEAKIIGEDAFYNSGLTVAVIPDTVKEIKFGAFRYSKNLERVLISDSVQYISKFAFYGCNLKEIVMPKKLYNIEIFAGINPNCKFDLF